jgi:heme exporter protein A
MGGRARATVRAVRVDFERVEALGLSKTYGATRALRGFHHVFRAGVVTHLHGPNGSGKSSLLALLALVATPTRGELRFGEVSPRERDQIRARIGFVSHAPMLYPDLTARENLALFAELYEREDVASAIDEFIERLGGGAHLDRPARTYSRGQLQRLSLGRALIARPRLLLLDEPTNGLDVEGVSRLRRIIEEERARGAIVVLVTHDGAFADAVAHETLSLHRGKLEQSS